MAEEKAQERLAGWCWLGELHTTNTNNHPTGNFLNPPFIKGLLTKKKNRNVFILCFSLDN